LAASQLAADGSFSDGFSTKVLPQAMATENIHSGTITGKLNGVMPAQTPTGWRIEKLSISRPTFSLNSPFSRCGMPQANSTTSRPRWIDPLASDSTLPCSAVTIRASSSMFSSISCLNRNITRARITVGVAAQPGSALRAESMAAATSSAEAKSTRPETSPVAGLHTSPARPLRPGAALPSMK
jgi:hypothetical protein